MSSLAALTKKLLIRARSNSGYSDGQLLYVNHKRELIAVPVDAPQAKVTGESHVLAEGVAYQPSVYWGAFTAGANGTVVYNTNAAAVLSVLAWCDRTGKELGRIDGPGVLANPSISPDGSRAAVDTADLKGSNIDIWIEPEKPIVTIARGDDILPTSWSLDDKQILCTFHSNAGGSDLVLIDVSTGKKVPFLAGDASETNGQISSDGKSAAHASNETGGWGVYVTTFPSRVGKWQVSHGGGTQPRWRGDGREIFYIGPKGMLTAVEVSTDGGFSTGTPSPLFAIHGRAPISSADLFTYDVARDGKGFLVNRYIKPDQTEPLTVVLNATTGMK